MILILIIITSKYCLVFPGVRAGAAPILICTNTETPNVDSFPMSGGDLIYSDKRLLLPLKTELEKCTTESYICYKCGCYNAKLLKEIPFNSSSKRRKINLNSIEIV